MKKIIAIMLMMAMLICGCGKAENTTTDPTNATSLSTEGAKGSDSTPEATEGTEPTAEPSEAPTEPSETPTESTEPSQAPSESIDPEPNWEADIANSGALSKGKQTVIGEYSTIEEAFSDYTIQRMDCEASEWNHFWEKYQEEQPVGHKEAFYLDDRTDVGFLVEVVDPDGDGFKEVIIEELYAFNKLYDEKLEAHFWSVMYYGESRRSIYATDEIVVIVGQGNMAFVYGDTYYYLGRRTLENPFVYTGCVRDGVVRYSRGVEAVTAMQSLYDWGIEHWYPGYGDELAAESGTVTLEKEELVFTPDETYTVEEWLLEKLNVKGDLEKTGYDSLDEYMEAYLYGELNPFKKL